MQWRARTLASNPCSSGSIQAECWLWVQFLLDLIFAQRLRWVLRSPPFQKLAFPNSSFFICVCFNYYFLWHLVSSDLFIHLFY